MFIVKMKLTNLNGLTNSTNDLFTLSDALCFEYQTAEPSWRRGFWGVSVKRANGLLRSCQFEPIRSQLHIASLPVGSDLNIKQADCKPPTQKNAAVCCLAGDGYRLISCLHWHENLRHAESKNCVIRLAESSYARDLWIVVLKQFLPRYRKKNYLAKN